jgi:nucleoside-diphosphate-sugar epimerase
MEDLIHAIELAIEKRHTLPETLDLLLGEDETLGYGFLQRRIGELLYNKPWWTIRIPKWMAKFGARMEELLGKKSFIKPWMIDRAADHYSLNIQKAKQFLEWQPHRNLRETLPRMIELFQNNPQIWLKENTK